jgi:hypothetical protein
MKNLLTLTTIASIGVVLALISVSQTIAASGDEASQERGFTLAVGF